MRTLSTLVFGTFAFVSSACATNVALTSLGATVSSNPSTAWIANVDGVPQSFPATNAIDGNTSTEWVAPGVNQPGGTMGTPYLLINLGKLFTVDSVTVDGVGNPGLTTSFDIYVGTLAVLMSIANGGVPDFAPVLTALNQPDGGAGWSLTGAVSTSTQVQYVLYVATNSTAGCSTNCFPGNASFSNGEPVSGQDDAFVSEILVNAVPEPATIALLALTILAAGFAWRSRTRRA